MLACTKTFLIPYLIVSFMAYPLSKWIVPAICSPWIRKTEGSEKIKDKTFIIAANHSSYFDIFLPPILVVSKINKKIHALANSFYWNNFITKFILNMWEAIPVYVDKEKDSKQKNKLAFQKAVNYLKKNELVMIFPEGARSSDGKLNKAYHGVAKLALAAKVPVLPFGIIDAHKVLPKGKMFPRFKRCEVKIGKPMYFDKYYNKKINKKILEEITRQIMKKIAKLIGQKYNY